MTTLMEASSVDVAFGSFVELQQANLALLEEKMDPAAGAGSQSEKIKQFIGKAVATGAILQRPSERKAAQAAIDYWTTSLILSRESPYAKAGLGKESAADAMVPPTVAVLNDFDPRKTMDIRRETSPYKGLDPFTRGDADDYFGREDAAEELQKRIEGADFIVLLLGPSGSGKSSLINAGLLPRLEDKGYKVVPVSAPGREPLAAILHAIKPAAEMQTIRSDERSIVKSPKKLNDVLTAVYPKAILIIDQFGEALARTDVQPSLAIVGQALASLAGTHKLLICIRESQRLQFEKITGIGAAVRSPANCFSPPPPSVYELRSMIEGPAEHVGLRFGEGVVEDLVRSVVGNPDALPLLQFTLNKLWDNRDRNEITQAVYRKVGSPREALTGTADAVLGQFSPPEQQLVRRIFLKLVVPAGDKDFVRNRVGRDTLLLDEDAPAVGRILDAFEHAKLLRKIPAAEIDGEDRFEVAHETLIGYWPTLASWLADARQEREKEAKLVSTARLWLDSGRDSGYLITGDALEQFKNYRSNSSEVNQLLEASFKRRDQDKKIRIGSIIATVLCAAAIVAWIVYSNSREANNVKEAELTGEAQARADSSAKLNSIKQAVVTGDQGLLRASLRALNIPDSFVNRVSTSPPANQTDEAVQTVAPPPAATPTPVPDKPIPPPPPQPQFDATTGDCFGFMWIGSKGNWKLKSPDSPEKLKPGPAITNASIYLRADFPTNPPEYAMAVPFGFVPDGTPISILETKSYQRDSGLQYWTKVAAPRKSCAKVSIQYSGSDELANQLRKSLTDANFQVAYAPEKVDRAAGLSEIRYFFKEDADLANAVAAKVKEVNGGKPVTLRPLLNFSASKPLVPGSLEVWVDLPMPAPTPSPTAKKG
jgi:hypothetical protein